MTTVPYLAGQASLWFQPAGPNTKPEYLGCHEVGDIAETFGDKTILYCPDPAQAGKWKAVGSFQGEPSAPTFSVTTDINRVADYLEGLKCPGNLYVHKVTCARRDNFTNYDRTFILRAASPTGGTLSNLAARSPDAEDRSTQSWDMSAEELIRIFQLTGGEQANTGEAEVTDIVFFNQEQCASSCGPATPLCQSGVVVGLAEYGAHALLMLTADGGSNWTDSATDPFAVAEDISAVVAFVVGRNTYRIIVGRGTTDGANPAEIAYSDDLGATWTNVDVGVVNGQFISAMFALDQYHIWAGSDDGYIYFSDDGGLTWTVQDAGVINANDVKGIHFADDLHGLVVYNDVAAAALTADGGVSWGAMTIATASDMLSCFVIDQYTMWAGDGDGVLWYTMDGGATWAQRNLPGTAGGNVLAISFINPLVGFIVASSFTDVPLLFRTIDGGYTWELLDSNIISGDSVTSALHVCDANNAFVGGMKDVTEYTAIWKLFPA